MPPEKQQLLQLIDDYLAAVATAVTLLNDKSEREPGFQVNQEITGVRAGYLDDAMSIHYQFHGIGCLVITPDFTVDFDFGAEGRCDGIDPGFLVGFIKANAAVKTEYLTLLNYVQVKQLLRELVNDQLLIEGWDALSSHVFYRVTDLQNPHPPKWQPTLPPDGI